MNNQDITNLLYEILDNQQIILRELAELKRRYQKLDNHINFVENIYDTVRKPFSYITGTKLKSIQDCNNQMDKAHNESTGHVHSQK